jgi:translation initiation factor 2D
LSNEAAEEKPKCDKDDETYTDPEETIESNQDHASCEELDPGSTEEKMDELVHNAFLQSLRTTAKKLELPILTSTFYRQHMLPACPSEIGGPIDLKKSSYKKLSKFLSKMMEDQVTSILT